MLVRFTNSGTVARYVSAIQKSLDAGAYVETRRTVAQLDAEHQLKLDVLAGDITLAFTLEAGDSVGLGGAPSPKSYTNATRPAANTVPTFTFIWNTDDNAYNYSDGATWRDATGSLT